MSSPLDSDYDLNEGQPETGAAPWNIRAVIEEYDEEYEPELEDKE